MKTGHFLEYYAVLLASYFKFATACTVVILTFLFCFIYLRLCLLNLPELYNSTFIILYVRFISISSQATVKKNVTYFRVLCSLSNPHQTSNKRSSSSCEALSLGVNTVYNSIWWLFSHPLRTPLTGKTHT